MSLVIATESFSGPGTDGLPYTVAAGQTYTTEHPAYAGREHLFRPAEEMAAGAREVPADHLKRGRRSTSTAAETADAVPGKPRMRTAPTNK